LCGEVRRARSVFVDPRALGWDLRRGVLGECGEWEVPTLRGPYAHEDTPGCDDAFQAITPGFVASAGMPYLVIGNIKLRR